MTAGLVPLDRDALYYPYIDIQDVNWLKATLLCFPTVKRIVPGRFTTRDSDVVREFLQTEGARGELLQNIDPHTPASMKAQARLRAKIEADPEMFRREFSKERARREFGRSWNKYRIYYLKFDYELRETLIRLGLAWQPKEKEWHCLHPRLGRAVMATIAVAVANEQGLDIVTHDADAHTSVVTQEPDDVFDELAESPRSIPPRTSLELVDELAGVFFTTYFDASKLTVRQIAELQKDGKDIRGFKQEIAQLAATIPDIRDPEPRRKRIEDAARQIHAQWHAYRKSLPRYAADAILDASEATLPASVSALLGVSTIVPFGVVAGLAFGIVAYTGMRMWRKYKEVTSSPYQYLNLIHRAGATLVAPTTVPGPRKR